VKRRPRAEGCPPPELAEFDPIDWIPAGASDAWAPTRAHEAWCAARSDWVAAGGVWPGGEGQREMGEAITTPDQPFDPSDL
jgi:hypothetical protein